MIERNEKSQLEICEVNIFVAKNYVVSIRQRAQQGFHSVRERCEREPELLKNDLALCSTP
jgi:magnesium transporter